MYACTPSCDKRLSVDGHRTRTETSFISSISLPFNSETGGAGSLFFDTVVLFWRTLQKRAVVTLIFPIIDQTTSILWLIQSMPLNVREIFIELNLIISRVQKSRIIIMWEESKRRIPKGVSFDDDLDNKALTLAFTHLESCFPTDNWASVFPESLHDLFGLCRTRCRNF
jgi:hypothetical protein